MKTRLDKFLANNGCGSRSDVKKLVKAGAVSVAGEIAKSSDMQIETETDEVQVYGKTIHWQEHYYYMLNKPAGVITASRDKKAETVLDLLDDDDRRPDIQAVGRLDKDTVGFLLLTDDGDLNHRLMSPKHHVDKTYYAVVDRELTDNELKEMMSGIDIGDDEPTLPCEIHPLTDEETDFLYYEPFLMEDIELKNAPIPEGIAYSITIHEGRYHQIKRMFEHYNSEVIYLKRVSIGDLTLDTDLFEGEYRELEPEELECLLK